MSHEETGVNASGASGTSDPHGAPPAPPAGQAATGPLPGPAPDGIAGAANGVVGGADGADVPPPASAIRGPAEGDLHPSQRAGRKPGRNLAAAVGLGLVFGVVVLLLLYFVKPAFVLLIAGFGALGVWEFVRTLRGRGYDVPLVLLMLIVVATVVATYVFGFPGLGVATAFGILAVLAWRMRGGVRDYVRDATAGVCVAVYVPVLMGFLSLLVTPADGAARMVTFIVVVFASDAGGLLFGATLGRHRMAPVISPKKSWEGMIGSVVVSAAFGAWLVWWLLDGTWWQGAIVGVVAAVVGTIGDLVESVIKRDLGVKDMSNLLPGHGGVMDRLDSLLAAAPAVWLLFTLLVPPGR